MYTPPPVCVELKVPQKPVGLEPHIAPGLTESLVRPALSLSVALTAIDFGDDEMMTTTGRFAIVNATAEDCDGSLVTFAVIVTIVPTGISEGAV